MKFASLTFILIVNLVSVISRDFSQYIICYDREFFYL